MDQKAAATYYVLYRLTQQGYAASPTTGGNADLMACTVDGRRVVLVRVRTRERGGWNMTEADRRPAGMNVAYVFVEFDAACGEPSALVLRAALVEAMLDADPSFPRDARALAAFEDCREGWHLLGLSGRSSVRSASAVSSSPVL